PWIGHGVLAVKSSLDVGETAHDVATAFNEHRAAALLGVRLAGMRQHVLEYVPREPQRFHRASMAGGRARARSSRVRVAFTGAGIPCAAARAATQPLLAS